MWKSDFRPERPTDSARHLAGTSEALSGRNPQRPGLRNGGISIPADQGHHLAIDGRAQERELRRIERRRSCFEIIGFFGFVLSKTLQHHVGTTSPFSLERRSRAARLRRARAPRSSATPQCSSSSHQHWLAAALREPSDPLARRPGSCCSHDNIDLGRHLRIHLADVVTAVRLIARPSRPAGSAENTAQKQRRRPMLSVTVSWYGSTSFCRTSRSRR
jgi:hypothetical protein